MSLTTNIVAYWKLDGNSNDSVASFNGTDSNITYLLANGIINQGAGFNGTNSSISVADSASLSPATITVATWVKVNSLPSSGSTMALIGKRDNVGGTAGWLLELENVAGTQKITWIGESNSGTPSQWTVTLTAGVWYYLVIVHSGTSATLYINAVSQGASGNFSVTNFAANLYIGSRAASNYYDGDEDEIGIWSRALSSSEVAQLYNGGSGLQYPFINSNMLLVF